MQHGQVAEQRHGRSAAAAWCASAAPMQPTTPARRSRSRPGWPAPARLAAAVMCRSRSLAGMLEATHSSAPRRQRRADVAGKQRLAEAAVAVEHLVGRRAALPRRPPAMSSASRAADAAAGLRDGASAQAALLPATSLAVRAGSDQRPRPWLEHDVPAGRRPGARAAAPAARGTGRAGRPRRSGPAGARPVKSGAVKQELVGAQRGRSVPGAGRRLGQQRPAGLRRRAGQRRPGWLCRHRHTTTPRSVQSTAQGGQPGLCSTPARQPATASRARRLAGRPAARTMRSPGPASARPGTRGSRNGRLR